MTVPFEILNRFTSGVQFTAQIDCRGDESTSEKRSLAVLWALNANAALRNTELSGADLSGADLSGADLSGAALRGTSLREADLTGANLRGADLSSTDLRGVNLRDANLRGVNLRGASLVHCGARSDEHEFYAQIRGGKIWIKAGCRYFTITDAAAHWKVARPTDGLGKESQQLLENARALVKIRGLL